MARILDHYHVQTIIDVRSQPYSKWAPDFTKTKLEESAGSTGFGYRWMGRTLGGRHLPDEAQLASGIDEVIGLCAASHVVLLCAEEDPRHCHRDQVLAPELTARGYEVLHILPGGEIEPYQERLII